MKYPNIEGFIVMANGVITLELDVGVAPITIVLDIPVVT